MSIRTVLGDLDAEQVQYMQSHDHIFIDGRGNIPDSVLKSGDPNVIRPVGQANYYWVRRNYFNIDNFLLDSAQTALRELLHYRRAGGDVLVDPTCINMGRRTAELAEVSQRSGVHIVLGTGFYLGGFQPRRTLALTIDEMYSKIEQELFNGIDDTGVKAGFVGEVGQSWPVDEFEKRSLTASARIQKDYGVTVQVHPGRDERAPLDIVERFTEAGGDPSKLIISHLDRTISDYAKLVELAETGCYIEIDLFGRESVHYPLSEISMPNDGGRLETIESLISEGYERQILIAQDVSKKVHLKEYGGEGYGHILENVMPLMLRRNFSNSSIKSLTRDNPLNAFAWPEG